MFGFVLCYFISLVLLPFPYMYLGVIKPAYMCLPRESAEALRQEETELQPC